MPLALGVQYITSTSQALQAPPWNLVMVGSILLTLPMIRCTTSASGTCTRWTSAAEARGSSESANTTWAAASSSMPAASGSTGGRELLLCASLFYFRLPREQWRARLEQVRASGYTCVDVYLPWNFHETGTRPLVLRRAPGRRRLPGPRARSSACTSSPGRARTSARSGTAARCRPGSASTPKYGSGRTSRASSPRWRPGSTRRCRSLPSASTRRRPGDHGAAGERAGLLRLRGSHRLPRPPCATRRSTTASPCR